MLAGRMRFLKRPKTYPVYASRSLSLWRPTPLSTRTIDSGKFAFGDWTIPIHARTLGPDEHNPNVMGEYYGAVQSAVMHTN